MFNFNKFHVNINHNQTLYESKSSMVHCKMASLPTATVILGIGSTKDGRIGPCAEEDSETKKFLISICIFIISKFHNYDNDIIKQIDQIR